MATTGKREADGRRRLSRSRPAPLLGPTLSLAEVMHQHPQLNSFGIRVYEPRRKTPEQRPGPRCRARR